ncbi:MAG TPA: transporter substrate-binding domain-containing protein [Paucimonas sp.]|nr:transporter substrate-binding domain-containing protein [Paucimonas sp.]
MNRRRRITLSIGCGLFLAAHGTGILAADASDRTHRLIIAYNDDYAPYSFVEDGAIKGILPDILNALLANMPDLKTESVGLPWRRVQAEVRAGIADALCTFASAERQEFTLFHKVPVVTLQPHLFFAADNPVRKTIEAIVRREELMKLRLVDLKGNNWAEQNLKDFPSIEYVPGHDNVFKMIMARRGDVHVSLSPIVTKWRIKKLGLPPDQIISKPAPFVAAEVPFHLLIRKTHPRAAEILKHLDDMLRKPGTPRLIEEITQQYL